MTNSAANGDGTSCLRQACPVGIILGRWFRHDEASSPWRHTYDSLSHGAESPFRNGVFVSYISDFDTGHGRIGAGFHIKAVAGRFLRGGSLISPSTTHPVPRPTSGATGGYGEKYQSNYMDGPWKQKSGSPRRNAAIGREQNPVHTPFFETHGAPIAL